MKKKQRTAEEIEAQKKKDIEDAKTAERARKLWVDDVNNALDKPFGRRMLRFTLGPQCTNLLGNNSDERGAAVALVNALLEVRPDAIQVLFATQEADEDGCR